MDEASINAERHKAHVLAPAHVFLQAQSASKLRREAIAVAKHASPELARRLESIKDAGRPVVVDMPNADVSITDVGGGAPLCTRMATIGQNLLGASEVVLDWPGGMQDEAHAIIRDLVIETTNGERGKLQTGRRVFAAAHEVAYMITEAPPLGAVANKGGVGAGGESCLWAEMAEATAARRPAGVPAAVNLELCVDVRAGAELRFEETEVRAVWARKKGKKVFTGMLALPLPPVCWSSLGFNEGFARLRDPDGPLSGLCYVVTPEEFHTVMAEFDNV
eukprot:7384786-Prymnesium_polylepis.6